MIKYLVVVDGVSAEVWLDTDDPNLSAPLQYSTDVPALRKWLEMQQGAFGHFIGSATSPIDLHYAMSGREAQRFSPELVEGAELVEIYDPGIPDDAVT